MELAVVAQQKIEQFITDGTVDKMIEEQVKKTLQGTVENLFREYSDFGKSLKDTLSEKMVVNLDNLVLDSYTNIVCKTIEEVLGDGVLADLKSRVTQQVKEVTGSIEKKEWKLSEIITKYRDDLDQEEYPEIVFDVEITEYSSIWVRMGEKVQKSSFSSYTPSQTYDIRVLLNKKTNIVTGVWYENRPIDQRKGKVYKNSLETFLMQLWVNNCVIELDKNEAEYEATKEKYED